MFSVELGGVENRDWVRRLFRAGRGDHVGSPVRSRGMGGDEKSKVKVQSAKLQIKNQNEIATLAYDLLAMTCGKTAGSI